MCVFVNLLVNVRPFLPSFLRSFVPSFLRSFVPSFLRSFVPSFLRSFVPSFLRSFVPSFLRSFVPSYVHALVPSYAHSFVRFSYRSLICSNVCRSLLVCQLRYICSFFLSFSCSFFRLSFVRLLDRSFILSHKCSFPRTFIDSFMIDVCVLHSFIRPLCVCLHTYRLFVKTANILPLFLCVHEIATNVFVRTQTQMIRARRNNTYMYVLT